MATRLPMIGCLALKMTPMPPSPICFSTMYSPTAVPAMSSMSCGSSNAGAACGLVDGGR